jgi:hypothetical protein
MTDAMGHDDYLGLLAGAALDDLDAAESAQLAAHREGCATCAEATERLDATMVSLALAVPQRRPSPGLETRIMAAVAAEPRTAARSDAAAAPLPLPTGTPGAGATTPRQVPTAPSRGGLTAWLRRPAFAMAAAGLAIVLAVTSLSLAMQASDLRSTVATQEAAIAVLANPAHVAAPLAPEDPAAGIAATAVYVPGSTESYVMATGLAATPPCEVYQLWSADTAGVHPLGTFSFDGEGTFVAPFGVDLSQAAAAMITIEPTGGATGEPGPQVVFGELPASAS